MSKPKLTTVVNMKHAPYDVYIGRAGHGQDGYFGNPIRKGAECVWCHKLHLTGGATLPCYRAYFLARLKSDAEFKRRVMGLKGKRLGCFCKPNPCHGDYLAEWANSH